MKLFYNDVTMNGDMVSDCLGIRYRSTFITVAPVTLLTLYVIELVS